MGSFGESYMKRILIAGAVALAAAGGQVLAADLPPAAAPPPRAPAAYIPPPPLFSWTGIYLGINGGYGFGQCNWTITLGAGTGNFNTSGFLIGGTLGANYQIGAFVIGLEGDGDWNNARRQHFQFVPWPAGYETRSTGWPQFAAVRAMPGIAFCSTERAAPLSAMFKPSRDRRTLRQRNPDRLDSRRRRRMGLPAELDREGRIPIRRPWQSWPVQRQAAATLSALPGTGTSVSFNENIVRAGINYKFGW